jgi:hypothetical protein
MGDVKGATGTELVELALEDVGTLESIRLQGIWFETKCLRCGKPIQDAAAVGVTAEIFHEQMILAVRFRAGPGPPTAQPLNVADAPGAPVHGQRASFVCERGHGPWIIKTETWFRWMIGAARRGRQTIYVPS